MAIKFEVKNATRGTTLGSNILLASSSRERRTGLLKHSRLEEGHGLWIIPCEGVHTFFMKFAIDVLYLDRKHRVRKVVPDLQPWRLSLSLPAHSVLELPAGTASRSLTVAGDQLELVKREGSDR